VRLLLRTGGTTYRDSTIRFHELRHSVATILLAAKIDLKLVSELLGHSSVAITTDVYAHVLPEQQQEIVDKMDDLFKRSEVLLTAGQRTITCDRLYTIVDGGGEKISLSCSFPLGEGGIHFRMNLNQRATQRSSTPNPATHPQAGMIYPRTTPITSRRTPATTARVSLRFFDDLLSTMVFSLTLYSRSPFDGMSKVLFYSANVL
jgi:hypothetical protein